jgi:uracil phosphoribosyltransferase
LILYEVQRCLIGFWIFLAFSQLVYEKLPRDIADRHVLLLDPILATGCLFLHFHYVICGS